ncbi:MAG: alcohol dehydrogenase family protein [Acidimicrobiia bacterium]
MSLPSTMRSFLLTGQGDLGQLEFRDDVPVPVPREDEVLVKVSACGVNNTDINTRTGWYGDAGWGGGLTFPRIQGADPVGRIVEAGSGVKRSRIGERVMIDAWIRPPDGNLDGSEYLGSERDGGFADYVTVPSINAYPIETDMTDVELASLPCSYATAEHMLHRAAVRTGQWVLVTGASGGVGSALIQLARRRGARVIAVTSPSKMRAVEDLGAEVVLDRSAADLADSVMAASSGGVDVLADVVGGELFPVLLKAVRRGGHYTTAGAVGGAIVSLDLRTLYLHDLTMHGATVLPPEVFANLIGYIERGEIRPLVAATYPLEELREAQESFMQRKHIGSIVIEVSE